MSSQALRARPLTAEQFRDRAAPLLVEREAENNLMLGIAGLIATQPERVAQAVFLALEANGALVAAAMRNPPHDLVVTRLPEGGAALVAAHFAGLPDAITGVVGPERAGLELAEALAGRLGLGFQLSTRQLVLELRQLREPAPAEGRARLATTADFTLLCDWQAEFAREVRLPHPGDPAIWANRVLESGKAWLWENGAIHALACFSRDLPHGRAIGPVYTAPSSRRRGYASALVAELSRQALASGRFACLFTDAANATSNHIYQAIGFTKVCSFDAYALVPPAAMLPG
jgi:predicted GNAT family acetyltransferase